MERHNGIELDPEGAFVYYDDAQATVEALQRERDGLEAKCLEEHVTIEQADAKVMKLEGDKGMWANERRDLLTQLENAESQLSQLRALVRALPVPEEGGFPIVEVDGDYYVNHTSRFSTKAEADAYTGLLIYRATLDATTPTKGGDGE